jgi:hypothetical protein
VISWAAIWPLKADYGPGDGLPDEIAVSAEANVGREAGCPRLVVRSTSPVPKIAAPRRSAFGRYEAYTTRAADNAQYTLSPKVFGSESVLVYRAR